MRVLAPALWGHVGYTALDDFQECLLHPLSRDVARYRGVFPTLAGDLVYLVYVDDAPFRLGHVEIGGLDQTEEDVLHVLADVAGLGEGGGVSDGEGHVEDIGQGARQERLAAAGGPQQQDVALLQLHFAAGGSAYALVVVVDRHGQDLLGLLLPHYVLAELLVDHLRRGNPLQRQLGPRGAGLVLVDDLAAQLYALVADVDGAGPGDQAPNLFLVLSTE